MASILRQLARTVQTSCARNSGKSSTTLALKLMYCVLFQHTQALFASRQLKVLNSNKKVDVSFELLVGRFNTVVTFLRYFSNCTKARSSSEKPAKRFRPVCGRMFAKIHTESATDSWR